MFDQMKRLMDLKKQAEQLKAELSSAQVEVNEVPGVKINISGAQNFNSIEIDESLLQKENKDKLQAELLRGLNMAIKKSQDLAARKMKGIMPGLPGM